MPTVYGEQVKSCDRDLSAEILKFQDEGWCVIKDVLDEKYNQEVLDRIWAAAKRSEEAGQPTYMPTLDPNASNVRVFYLLEHDAIFRELIAHPTAVKMVQGVMGQEFSISNFTANIARPGSKSMGLHSDLSLMCPDPWVAPWNLNCIWCLHDIYGDNGATLYIPGSHKWQSVQDVPADAESMLQPFEAKAGSILVMDGRLWHTSGANITKDKDRALLFGSYNAAFLRGQVNWAAGLSQATKDTLSPELRDWLGIDVSGNIGKVKGVNRVHYNHEKEAVKRELKVH